MEKKKKVRAFMFYSRWADLFLGLPDTSRLELLNSVLNYFLNGAEPDIEDPILLTVFNIIKTQIDEDQDKYVEICKKRAEAARRNREQKNTTNANTCNQEQTNESKCEQMSANINKGNVIKGNINKLNINKKEKEKEKEKKSTRFIPPTLEEIKTYCAERKNNIDPVYFLNYYESVNWQRGKSPVKDWKATIRSWEARNFSNAPPKQKVNDFFSDIKDEEIF